MVFSLTNKKEKDSMDGSETIRSEVDTQRSQPSQSAIYYFGLGPIVNSQVRKRQRYDSISNTRAAVLKNHRLTFCYGGIVNVVAQRGYEVHGVVMKWDSEQEWDRWVKTHPGYQPEVLEVFPYDATEFEDSSELMVAVYANVFVFKDWDEQTINSPVKANLPSERYLKLIAMGMREAGADEDFINDEIMSVPFTPSRSPEEYQTFPWKKSTLPKISTLKYNKMCKNKTKTDIYFMLGCHVFQVDKPFSRENPGIQWVIQHCHGQGDSTMLLHKTCVEPGLPVVDEKWELTYDHLRWAENEAVEFLKRCGVSASRVYELDDQQQKWSLFGR